MTIKYKILHHDGREEILETKSKYQTTVASYAIALLVNDLFRQLLADNMDARFAPDNAPMNAKLYAYKNDELVDTYFDFHVAT